MASVLSKYKRQPKLQISLPSQGKWWPPGSLEKWQDLDVYSMTSGDEIAIKTPDILFNGDATVKLIQSCIPAIKNAWHVPLVDLYTVLAAIRMASYGENLAITSACPNCAEMTDFDVPFNNLLELYQTKHFISEIRIDELTFHVKPLSYKDLTEVNKQTFKLQRQLQQKIPNIEDQDVKDIELQKIYDGLSNLQTSTVIHCVSSIETPEGLEKDWNTINTFIRDSESTLLDKVVDTHVENSESFGMPENRLKCQACEHEYTQPSELDWSNFFGSR